MDDSIITEDVVVLIQRDKTFRPFKLKKGRKLHFEKVSFYPDGAIGEKYGSLFKIEKQKLQLVNEVAHYSSIKGEECGSDNRALHDDGSSQTLTERDIRTMKGEGMSGQGIVSTMIEKSATFKEKTKYSQEKYIKKKQQKYVPLLRIIRPTTRLLCDLYFTQSPGKINYLRKDSLARILSLSNIHAHSNMVVMETCQGFMVGAMLERMGGCGSLVQVFFGDSPVRPVLENFSHLSEKDRSILYKFPLDKVGSLLKGEESHCAAASLGYLLRDQPQAKTGRGWQARGERKRTTGEGVASDRLPAAVSSGPPFKRPKTESSTGAEEKQQVDNSLESAMPGTRGGGGVSGEEGKVMMDTSVLASAREGSGAGGREAGSGGDNIVGSECVMEVAGSNDGIADSGEGHCTEHVFEASENCGSDEDAVRGGKRGDSVVRKTLEGKTFRRTEGEDKEDKLKKKKEKMEAYKAAGDILSQRKMDGLVVVGKHHPVPVVMSLINFLAPSRPLVVFSLMMEPLVQCYKILKESGLVFQMQISETWMRNYQVLEERTHPAMLMEGQSGYVLSAVVVQKNSSQH